MELNKLKKIWDMQDRNWTSDHSGTELLRLARNHVASLEKEIKARDRVEIGAAVVLVFAFTMIFFLFSSPWIKVGCGIIVLAALFICYKLMAAHQKLAAQNDANDQSLQKQLLQELKGVRAQKKLLQKVAWWYILPICSGLVLFTLGSEGGWLFRAIYLAVVFLMALAIWYVNQQAVANRFEPLIEELNEALRFLQDEE